MRFGQKTPHVGAGTCGIWGHREETQNAIARNNALGGSTACATRAWRKHALLSFETL